ncbi:uncharacterized protein PgNI_11508 [Pyricularia grisea]|uniref:Uncharacterized protein n=1 Tax=Pyricularia grisea TaxID=148305 RepID=A0A6P8ANC9_PYRGI|nr:uncharacterized protein PgNI_11508 [Pyricularia grisea]TLD03547.1 hypothetical protein PgNI_11508 [Pyricularia grisea]
MLCSAICHNKSHDGSAALETNRISLSGEPYWADGLIGNSAMVYMSEVALPQLRGTLLASSSLAFSLGQFFLAVALKALEVSRPFCISNVIYAKSNFFGQ